MGTLYKLFVALQISGGGGLFIILATATLGRSIQRYSTWYSFCASWIYSCVSYSLYTIQIFSDETQVTPNLCAVQAALIYAAPPLTGCTTLAFMVHTLLGLRSLLARNKFPNKPSVIAALLIVPYIIWVSMFVGVLVFELQNPDTVRQVLPYCDSASPTFSKISSLIVIFCMTLMLIVQAMIGGLLHQHRKVIVGSGHSITMVLRVMAFSFLGLLGLGLAVTDTLRNGSEHKSAFDTILALLPVSAVLLFGTNLDLVHVWMFWRRVPSRANWDMSLDTGPLYSPLYEMTREN